MTFALKRPQVILSLCDGQGSWSQPYVDDDYDVIRVDIQTGWALENPVGTLSQYLGPPALVFHPFQYGDPYTKRTCLWGTFTEPARTPVPAEHGSLIARMPDSLGRAARRAATPAGFARAFFDANP